MIELSNLSCIQEELIAVNEIAQSQLLGGELIGSGTALVSSEVFNISISNADNPDGTFSVVYKDYKKSSKTFNTPLQLGGPVTNISLQASI